MHPLVKHLNIVTFVGDQILLGKWQAGQRIPSVRELAIELKVHTNTIMRSYKFLRESEIIFQKRGLGLFISTQAYNKIKANRKEQFFKQELLGIFRNINLLDLYMETIEQWYRHYLTMYSAKTQPKTPHNA